MSFRVSVGDVTIECDSPEELKVLLDKAKRYTKTLPGVDTTEVHRRIAKMMESKQLTYELKVLLILRDEPHSRLRVREIVDRAEVRFTDEYHGKLGIRGAVSVLFNNKKLIFAEEADGGRKYYWPPEPTKTSKH